MTYAKILDLDKVVTEDILIILDGTEYKLPKSVPLKTAFSLMRLFNKFNPNEDKETGDPTSVQISTSDPEMMIELFTELSGIFQPNYPDVTPEFLVDHMSLQQAMYFLKEIMGQIFEMQEAQGNQ